MKNLNKVSIVVLATAFAISLAIPIATATVTLETPSLGAAACYTLLSDTYTNTTVTTINGDVGFTTGPAVAPLGSHTNYGSGAPYSTAGTDQGSTLSTLNSEPCNHTFPAGPVDLATDTSHGPMGVYTPGVYCALGAASIGTGGITLGSIPTSGTYIFRINGAFTTADNSSVTLIEGIEAKDVFWTPTAATTLGADTTFAGTIIDDSGITVGANTTWTGRALAFGGTVTTDTNTITAPICTFPDSSLKIVKIVVNDDSGTKTVADFSLFVNGAPVVSDVANTLPAPASYTVTETADSGYTRTFSGACDASGVVNLVPGDIKTCTITNDDVAPAPSSPSGGGGGSRRIVVDDTEAESSLAAVPGLPDTGQVIQPQINVTKIPTPTALNYGGGIVTYANVVTNPGAVALSNVRLTDDKCAPVSYISGDTNGDSQLDNTETWIYTCQAILNKTTTNTVLAEGDANGFTSRSSAAATVVVPIPNLPNTGFPPQEKNSQGNFIIPVGILVVILFLNKKRLAI